MLFFKYAIKMSFYLHTIGQIFLHEIACAHTWAVVAHKYSGQQQESISGSNSRRG